MTDHIKQESLKLLKEKFPRKSEETLVRLIEQCMQTQSTVERVVACVRAKLRPKLDNNLAP